jgi:hypothetical protein
MKRRLHSTSFHKGIKSTEMACGEWCLATHYWLDLTLSKTTVNWVLFTVKPNSRWITRVSEVCVDGGKYLIISWVECDAFMPLRVGEHVHVQFLWMGQNGALRITCVTKNYWRLVSLLPLSPLYGDWMTCMMWSVLNDKAVDC